MTYQEEKNKILFNILNNLWFKHWKVNDIEGLVNKKEYTVELFVTAKCNQKCEYCYLHKYENLYPIQYDKPELILKNLRIFFDWLLENKYLYFRNFDIFSGEIHGYKLGNDVYDIILEYLDKGLVINQITVPTNGSWILDDDICSNVEQYIAKFKQRNTRLCYSFSVDGYIVDKIGRPLRSIEKEEKRTIKFYDKMLQLCDKYGLCWHAVVGAGEAKYWSENIQWWYKQCDKYHLDFAERCSVLEARNNDWDKDSLHALTKAYDTQIDYMLKKNYVKLDGTPDLEGFARHVFLSKDKECGLNPNLIFGGSHIGCTNPVNFTVRLGDLAICSCHRTAYDELLFGNFVVENDKITGISAKNVEMAIKALCGDVRTCIVGCDSCDFKPLCYLQCLGACKEYKNDPFIIEPKVCELLKVRLYHLCKKYENMGLFDIYKHLVETSPGLSKNSYEKCIEVKNKILSHKELEIYE